MPNIRPKHLAVIAAVSAALAAPSPAAAACLRATATYTSPSGSSTTLGSNCIVSTPYNEGFRYTDSGGTTSLGTVTVSVGVPMP